MGYWGPQLQEPYPQGSVVAVGLVQEENISIVAESSAG